MLPESFHQALGGYIRLSPGAGAGYSGFLLWRWSRVKKGPESLGSVIIPDDRPVRLMDPRKTRECNNRETFAQVQVVRIC